MTTTNEPHPRGAQSEHGLARPGADQERIDNEKPQPRSYRVLAATHARMTQLQTLAGLNAEQYFAFAADLLEERFLGTAALETPQTSPLRELMKSFEAWNARLVVSIRHEVDRLVERAVVIEAMEVRARTKETAADDALIDSEARIAQATSEATNAARQAVEHELAENTFKTSELQIEKEKAEALTHEAMQRAAKLDSHLARVEADLERTRDSMSRLERQSQLETQAAASSVAHRDENVVLRHRLDIALARLEIREREVANLCAQLQAALSIATILSNRDSPRSAEELGSAKPSGPSKEDESQSASI